MNTMERVQEKKKQACHEMMVPIIKMMTDEEFRRFYEHAIHDYLSLNVNVPYLIVLEAILYHPKINAQKLTQPTLVVLWRNRIRSYRWNMVWRCIRPSPRRKLAISNRRLISSICSRENILRTSSACNFKG